MRLLWERYVGPFLPYPSAPASPPQLAHQGGGEPSQQHQERLQHPIARSLLSRSFRPGRVPLRQTPATLLTDMAEKILPARSSAWPPPVGPSPFAISCSHQNKTTLERTPHTRGPLRLGVFGLSLCSEYALHVTRVHSLDLHQRRACPPRSSRSIRTRTIRSSPKQRPRFYGNTQNSISGSRSSVFIIFPLRFVPDLTLPQDDRGDQAAQPIARGASLEGSQKPRDQDGLCIDTRENNPLHRSHAPPHSLC